MLCSLSFDPCTIKVLQYLQVLGAEVKSQATTSYLLNADDKILRKATSVETHFLRVEARKQSGAEVISRQILQLKGKFALEFMFLSRLNIYHYWKKGNT